jgi:hypothetical protein
MADQWKPESNERVMGGDDEEVRGKAAEEEEDFEDAEDLDEEDAEDEEGSTF